MNYYTDIQNEYTEIFNESWNAAINHQFFTHKLYAYGNRMRPLIVLGGYLASRTTINITREEMRQVAELSVSIELIHKASLILDDMIDNDVARHGNQSFHASYGNGNTIMFALYTISKSFQRINEIIAQLPKDHMLANIGMKLMCDITEKMSFGELLELNLDKKSKSTPQVIQQIIDLETSSIIFRSLQLGYYLGNGRNLKVSQTFEEIGKECGYIFQVMNDLEPFCNERQYFFHKGNMSTDYISSKKNIAICLLLNTISKSEKKNLENKELSIQEINKLIIHYFEVYHIKDTFMRDVDTIHKKIGQQIQSLTDYGINAEWCDVFNEFINRVVQECNARL